MKTRNTEPSRKSQICGYQIEYGTGRSVYCAEHKAPGLYFCAEHDEWVRSLYGPSLKIAAGNVKGHSR